MLDTNDEMIIEAKRLLKWGYRSLYLLLFISCMVIMGYEYVAFTLPFLGSIFACLFPLIFSKKELLPKEALKDKELVDYEF